MFNSQHQNDLKIRSCARFEKSNFHSSRYPVYSFRRPFPLVRRRMMAGRYPNMGFRPIGQPALRTVCFPPRDKVPYPTSSYSAPRTASPVAERPPFTSFNIPLENHNPQHQALNPDLMNNPCNQRPSEITECISQLNKQNSLSNVWVETLAPSGKKYYYNANTRATSWTRPAHSQIIELNEIKRLQNYGMECIQNSTRANLNSFAQQFPSRPYGNNVFIRNIPLAPRFFAFPPPQTVYNPSVLPLSVPGSVQINSNITFNPVAPPLPFPAVSSDQILNNATIDNQVVPAEENKLYPFAHGPNNEFKEKEYTILDWGISNSETSLCSQNSTTSQENVCVKEQDVAQYISDDSYLNMSHREDTKTESDVLSFEKQENSSQDFAYSKEFMKREDEEGEKDEIRTSTPISETKRHVIDGKTSYFDSEHETSVWEPTKELTNSKLLTEQNVGENMSGNEQKLPSESDDCNNKCENKDSEPKKSLIEESQCLTVEEQKENKTEQVDKTRPVSSTPVSGTSWFVVWTGDEKVFYFDSLRKISVWERPVELLNRLDVQKLIEKSPLSEGIKSSKKESRKIESDNTDITKKIKKEHENDTELKEENENEDNIQFKNQENIPHEERVKTFCEMLAEKKVSAFSTWEKELHKIVFDSRYLLLPSKERKQVFESFISKKIEEEKKERQKQLQNQKKNFLSLLKEIGVNTKSRFSDISKLCAKDSRFKSIEKLRQREHLFNEYISELIKKERDRDKIKVDRKKKFLQLLGEQKFTDSEITWEKMKEKISEDERYKDIQSNSVKEELFKEYVENLHTSSVDRDRITTSIQNREKEVKRDLSVHLRYRKREQENHKSMSAKSNFHALLNDLIKKTDISWHSAKKLMKKDHRWDLVECLESGNLEELFNQHIDSLHLKKREQFHSLLDEIPDLTFKSSWLDIRKAVLNDPRCAKFSSSERKCEKEFKDYLRRKLSVAKADFQKLLRETKIITYKSKSLLSDTNHFEIIEEVLAQDRRYLNLDCVESDRREILRSYIDELHENGPPPPPTATRPSDRLK